MKLLTSNFLTCAVKSCRGHADAYPLQFSECVLEKTELEYNPAFIRGIMPRIEWAALVQVCSQLGNNSLPLEPPNLDATTSQDSADGDQQQQQQQAEGDESIGRALHEVLLETSVKEGKMVCGKCGHVYLIKEGIANMLLAEHEVV